MIRTVYLYRNLTRNVRRTILTCLAVALPIVIFVLSVAVIDAIEAYFENSVKQLRLVVMHKASMVADLPSGYRTKIEAMDPGRMRLRSVCAIDWIGGKVEGNPQQLSTLGADVDTFVATFPEYDLAQDEIDAWLRDRQAIIVGRATAEQFGWKKGDRVTIRPSLPPYSPMEFRIVSTAPNAQDPVTNWFRRDYLQEKRKEAGFPEGYTGFFFIKCATQTDLDYFRTAIDELFARSPDETRTQDEKTFMNEFITQQFNLPRNLAILASVTVFVAVMAAANTMAMNFRDRSNEVAVLKSLGFSGGLILAQVLAESLLLCGVGGLGGAFVPWFAFMHTPLRNVTIPIIMHLDISLVVCAQALLISLGIGVVAAVWPSWLALRMKVVSALRNLE
jgi:putative ABC transport system permease protein